MMKTILNYIFSLSLSANILAIDLPNKIQPRKYNLKESTALALAKEMCSCLFVAKQDESYCKTVTKESRIIGKYSVDYEKKSVMAKIKTSYKYRALAIFNTEKPYLGCKIVKAQQFSRPLNGWYMLEDHNNAQKIREIERFIRLGKSFEDTTVYIERKGKSVYVRTRQ